MNFLRVGSLVVIIWGFCWTAHGAPVEVTSPVVSPWGVLSLKSLDRTHEVLTRAAELFSCSVLTDGLAKLEKVRGLSGLNSTAPIVLLISSVSEDLEHPRLVLVLPMSDVSQFIASCRGLSRLKLEEVSASRWNILSNDRTLYAMSVDQSLIIVNDMSLLDAAGSGMFEFPQSRSEMDVSFRFLPEGIPADLRQNWRGRISSEIDELQSQIQQSTRAEAPLLLASLQFLKEWGRHWIQGTDFIEIGARLDSTLHVEACWFAKPDSVLAGHLSRLPLKTAKVDRIALGEPALESTSAMNVPVAVRALLALVFVQIRETVSEEIGPRLKPADRKPAEGALFAISDTVGAGRLESYWSFTPNEQDQMSLYGTIRCQGTDRIRESLKTVLPYASQSDEIRSVSMNVVNEAPLTIHRLAPTTLKKEERLLYGDEAAYYMGTSEQAFVFAVGNKELIAPLAGIQTEVTQSPDLLLFRCHLKPWLKLLLKHKPEQPVLSQLVGVFPDQQPADLIQMRLRAEQQQLKLTLDLEHGCLKFLSRIAALQEEHLDVN